MKQIVAPGTKRALLILLPLSFLCQTASGIFVLCPLYPLLLLVGLSALAYLYAVGYSPAVFLSVPLAALAAHALGASVFFLILCCAGGIGALCLAMVLRRGAEKTVCTWALAAVLGLVALAAMLWWFYRHVGTPVPKAIYTWLGEKTAFYAEKIASVVSAAFAQFPQYKPSQTVTSFYSASTLTALFASLLLRAPGLFGAGLFLFSWLCIGAVQLFSRMFGQPISTLARPFRIEISRAGAALYVIGYVLSMLLSLFSDGGGTLAATLVLSNFLLLLMPGLFIVGCRTLKGAFRHPIPQFRRLAVVCTVVIGVGLLISPALSFNILILIALYRILFFAPRFPRGGADR